MSRTNLDEVYCPVCSTKNVSLFTERSDPDQECFKCYECSFYFIWPHEPWIPTITDDEDEESFRFWGSKEAEIAYDKWRDRENERVSAQITSSAESGKLLEIGTGEGPLTERLIDTFDDYWGIEPVKSSALRIIDRIGLDPNKILVLKAEDIGKNECLAAENGTFDAIVMISVFEHVSLPVQVLQSCSTLLRPGGKIFVSTPDSTFFPFLTNLRKLLRLEPWTKFHVSFFSRKNLVMAFESAGFQVSSLTTHSLVNKESAVYFGKLYGSRWLERLMVLAAVLRVDKLLRIQTFFVEAKKL